MMNDREARNVFRKHENMAFQSQVHKRENPKAKWKPQIPSGFAVRLGTNHN